MRKQFIFLVFFLLWACSSSKVRRDESKPAAVPSEAPLNAERQSVLNVPGFDFSGLPDSAKTELASVFLDEFCYCGCPHTLGACLKSHEACPHARRMAKLAATAAYEGASAVEILAALSQYYQSFSEPRSPFRLDEKLCKGNPKASVTLVEFSDFQCPFCAAMAPVLEEVLKQRPDVRLCYKPFPLNMHPQAFDAAQVALWAKDNGRFWPMHDGLFQNQSKLGPEEFRRLALSMKLDGSQLQKILRDKPYSAAIQEAKEEGTQANIRGTPSVFVNGRRIGLGLSLDVLLHTLDDEAEWVANGNNWAADKP